MSPMPAVFRQGACELSLSEVRFCRGLSLSVSLVSEFELIFDEVIVCALLGDEGGVCADFNDLATVDDHDLVGIFDG